MNKLELHIFNTHRTYFCAMLNQKFDLERRLRFGDNAHREMFMFGTAQNGIIARYPQVCFGIAP